MNRQEIAEPTLVTSIIRFWWVVAGMVLVSTLSAIVYARVIANDWVATSSLLVEEPKSSQVFTQAQGTPPDRYIADQVAIIESSTTAQLAIEHTGSTLPEPVPTVEELLGSTEVTPVAGSNVIGIEVTHESPDVAVALVTAIAEVYEERLDKQAASGFAAALEQLEASLTELDQELLAIEAEIERYANGLTSSTTLDQRLDDSITALLALIETPSDATDGAELAGVLEQLQTLQLIRAVQAQQPELVALYASQQQAFQRRAQLALRTDQIRVDAALASSGVTSVSAPIAATAAVSLSRAALVGVLLGLLLGSVIAYLVAARARRFTLSWEPGVILSAPLLAEVPDFVSERLKSLVPTRDAPVSAAAEAYRFAAAALTNNLGVGHSPREPLFEGDPQSGQVLLFSSPVTGDGKTVSAANVALAAGTSGRNVLLVDCDFGDPALTRLLKNGAVGKGLTDIVDGDDTLADVIHVIPVSGKSAIDLLTRGLQPTSAPRFFRGKGVETFFEQVRSIYDLVIIDSPPILQVAYSRSLVELCDGVLMVVRHGSPIGRLEEAVERLEVVGTRPSGYLYNAAPLRSEMLAGVGSTRNSLGLTESR